MPQLKSHLSEKLTMPLLLLKLISMLISMQDVNKNADRLIIAKRKKRRVVNKKDEILGINPK